MAEILYNEIYPKGATTKNIVAKSKDVKYAKAGTTIVYDTFEEYTYGTPVITVEYKTVLSRNGGSIKPTVTYSLTRTKRGYSERAYKSETISGTVESFTATGKILNSSEATIDTSNGTVSRNSLGTTYKSATWNIMEVTITATINGVSASGTGIARMLSNTYTDSGGVTTYDNVVKGSITHGYISAAGGSATATATAGSQKWYTSEVIRTFLTSATEVIKAAKSGTNTILGTTLTVSKDSKGTDISNRTVAGTKTVTWAGLGNKSATGTLYVYQNANYVTELTLSGGGLAYDTFTAAGTTKTPKTSTSKTVTFKFTSGSTTTTVPSSTYGSLSRSVSYGMTKATGFTLNSSSTGSITASNNKSTSARSTTAYRYEKATWTPSSSYPDANTINSSQGSNSCTISLSKGSYSYSSWSVSISASPTSGISAKGGSSTVTASASRTYGWNGATSGVGTQSGTIKLSIPSAVSGSSLSGTASGSTLTWSANYSTSARGVKVRATCQENTSVYKEVTITQNGDTKSSTTTEYSVSISANRYTSSSSSCPAAGGSATLTYSGFTRERYDWVSGDVTYSEWVSATPEISGSATGFTRDGTSVTISSLGVGTKNARSVTYTAKVGTASKSVTIYQQANAVTSTAYKFSTFSLSKKSFTAAGGSATLSMVVLRQYTYTSTSKGDWTTITPSSGTLSVSAGTGGSVGSISYGSTSTCTITVAAYTNTSSNRTISISGNYNSGSATASTSITQTKDAISSYGNVTAGSLSYSISRDIPASGGTVTITPSAGSLPVYWVSGRETSQTVSAPSSLSIYGDNLGTSKKSRTSLGTKTFTWVGSGNKTASVTSKTIYQQANTITNSDYNSKNGNYWASCDIGTGITAGGGSATVSKSAGHTHYYLLKYTSNEVAPSSTTYYNYSVSDSCTIKITTNGNSRFTLDGTTLKHSSMGTSETTDTCTITCTNNSYTSATGTDTISVTNKVTNTDYDSSNYDFWASCEIGTGITAAGGSATVTKSAGHTHKYYYLYTSGSTSAAKYSYPSDNCTIKITSNGNNRFNLDGTTLNHSPMGTNAVTDTCTITCTNSSSTSATGTDSVSVSNAITNTSYGSWSYNWTTTDNSTRTRTITYTYTSNATSTSSESQTGGTRYIVLLHEKGSTPVHTFGADGSGSFKTTTRVHNYWAGSYISEGNITGVSCTCSGFTCSVSGSTLTITASDLGTTIANAKSKTVTASKTGFYTRSGLTCIALEGNYVTAVTYTPADPVTSQRHFYYGGACVAAGGGTKAATLNGNSILTFSSGSTKTGSSHTGVSISFSRTFTKTGGVGSVNASGTITFDNNKSTSMRYCYVSSTLTIAVKHDDAYSSGGTKTTTSTGTTSCCQHAGYYSYAAWTVSISASPTTISAAGGSSTITASASRTYGWNGTTSGVGTQNGTVTLSIPTTTGASLSGNTLTWTANTSTTSERSVNVTATCKEDTSKTKSVTIKLNKDTISYYNTPTFDMWWSSGAGNNGTPVSAAGGKSASPTYSVSQTATYVSGTVRSVTPSITSAVFSLNDNTTVSTAEVNSSTGAVTFGSAGTSELGKEHVEVLLTLVSHGKTGTDIGWCYQAANTKSIKGGVTTYGAVTAGTITNKTIPAGGTTTNYTATARNGSQTYSTTRKYYLYTSGSEKTITNAASGSVAVAPSHASISATASTKGTTISEANVVKSQTVTWASLDGTASKNKTSTMYIYLAANYVISVSPYASNSTYNHFYYNGTVSAAGGSLSPTGNGAATFTFSSGSKYSSGSAGSILGGTVSYKRTYSLTATTGASMDSTGKVTWTANTSTSKRSATVSSTLTVTYTHPSGINNGKAVSGTLNGTAICSLNADSITNSTVSYSGLKCTLTNNLTASGGSATVKVTTLKITTHTWASGKNPTYEYVNYYDVTSSATKTIDHATLFNTSGAVIEASTRFSISGATVSHSSMLDKVGIDKVCVKAVFSGLTAHSDYASVENRSWYVYAWKTLSIRATTVGYGALNVTLTRSGTLTKTLTYTSGYSDPGTTINVSPSFDSLSIQSGSGCSIYNILLGIIRWSENTGTGLRSVYLQGSVTANNVAKSFSNIIATQRGKEVHNFTLSDNTSDAGAWIDGWNNGSASDISFTDTTGNWFNTLSSIYVVIENTDDNPHTFLLSATGGSVDMTSVTIDAGDLVNITFTPNSLVFNHVLDIDLYS